MDAVQTLRQKFLASQNPGEDGAVLSTTNYEQDCFCDAIIYFFHTLPYTQKLPNNTLYRYWNEM